MLCYFQALKYAFNKITNMQRLWLRTRFSDCCCQRTLTDKWSIKGFWRASSGGPDSLIDTGVLRVMSNIRVQRSALYDRPGLHQLSHWWLNGLPENRFDPHTQYQVGLIEDIRNQIESERPDDLEPDINKSKLQSECMLFFVFILLYFSCFLK